MQDFTLSPMELYRALRSALMIKIGPIVCFNMVSKSAFCILLRKAFQHPGHVAADIAHGLKAFQVLANFIGRHA